MLHIGGGHAITADPELADPYGIYAVWTRWASVRDLTLRRPSPTAWAPALYNAFASASTPAFTRHQHYDPDAALLPAFDRWGDPTAPIGDSAQGLSPQAVSAILHTHLTGPDRPATHRTQWTHQVIERRKPPTDPVDTAPVRVELENTYDQGIDARCRASADLDDLDDLFDALDHQMTVLLQRTEQLLDQPD